MKMYTHAGLFHADEVAAYSILSEIYTPLELVRLTNIQNIPEDGIVVDIGREHCPQERKFDHHQGFIQRENGYPYASCGLIWAQYGTRVVVENLPATTPVATIKAVAKRVDERLIQGIDAHDADNSYNVSAQCNAGNVAIKSLSNVISAYNAEDIHDSNKQHAQFNKAANVFLHALQSEIRNAGKYIEACLEFEDIAEFEMMGEIVILKRNLPWREIIHEDYPKVRFAIVPSSHPGSPWALIARSVTPDSRELMQPIERPNWFKGFIHQGKWIAGCQDVREAVHLAAYNL